MIKRGIDPDNLFSQYRLNYLVLKAVLLRWTMSTDSMSETILSFHVSYTQAMSYLSSLIRLPACNAPRNATWAPF